MYFAPLLTGVLFINRFLGDVKLSDVKNVLMESGIQVCMCVCMCVCVCVCVYACYVVSFACCIYMYVCIFMLGVCVCV